MSELICSLWVRRPCSLEDFYVICEAQQGEWDRLLGDCRDRICRYGEDASVEARCRVERWFVHMAQQWVERYWELLCWHEGNVRSLDSEGFLRRGMAVE